MFKRLALLFVLFILSSGAIAQNYSITGHIVDATDTSSLIGVAAILTRSTDTAVKTGAVTDAGGNFLVEHLEQGVYSLRLEYMGYKPVLRTVTITAGNIDLGTIKMTTSSNQLKGVTVEGKQIRAEQKGDTTQFRADAYKTNPDASAEDLVSKMPGVTSDNSGVKVNGENVQQVYVDGKPFFGNDPTLALKNLPAEVIDKIQIFDRLSDQATFTGFDDGNTQKTMNIITRRNKSEGEFGKAYAGIGTDGTYLAGGNLNIFNGDRRISILELSNNINQQNFSSQDILGVSSGGGGGGRGGGRGGFGGGGMFGGGGSNAANNFLTGTQNGINTTHSFGINYSDQWGKKIKITSSYFFNYSDNLNNTQLSRNYTFPAADMRDSLGFQALYNEGDTGQAKNFNHRFNVRFEYTIDSFNSLIVTPGLSLQENYSMTGQFDSSYSILGRVLGNAVNSSSTSSSGYTFSNNILFQHKMQKKGRTISVNVGTTLNEKTGDGTINTLNGSLDTANGTYDYIPLSQKYDLYNNSNTISGTIGYTEPIGKKSQLMLNYNPSFTNSRSDKETDSLAPSNQYFFYPVLSNKYASTYLVQKGGVSYRVGDKMLNFMVGLNYQYTVLEGTQTFPVGMQVNKPFSNLLPNSFFNYRFKDGRNLRIMYRTSISPPSITQLQNVVDRSNPLQLSTGNPNLKQDYEQTLTLRYGLTKSKTARNFFIYGYANYINDYIGTATYTNDSSVPAFLNVQGVRLTPGHQLTAPVNLNYYSNTKLFLTYGMPADFIKSNVNVNGGINYTHTPGLINTVSGYSNNYAPSAGIVISSNVSEKLDFTLAYTGNYNFVRNTLQGAQNNNYYSHTASFKINWIFLKGFVFNTNISHNYYSTLSSSAGNTDYLLWNAYVGYKFFKDRSLEARISAFDILNQNKSISRIVGANYVENDVTTVLKQYFMFQLTYTLRHFKGALPVEENSEKDNLNIPKGMNPGGGKWHNGG